MWVCLNWCELDGHDICRGLILLAALCGLPYYCDCECHRRVQASSE